MRNTMTNTMTNITAQQAYDMIENYDDGLIFHVKFVKRSDGKIRDMTCRKGVKKFLKGGSLAFNPKEKKLVTVWDRNAPNPGKGYRSIPLDSILEVKMNGNVFVVKG